MNTKEFQTIPSRTSGMKDIVGVMTREGTITNLPGDVVLATREGQVKMFLDRKWMELMAALDLGPQWEKLASGPTLFSVDWETKEITPGLITWAPGEIVK